MVKEVRPPTVVKPRSSLGDQQPATTAGPSLSKLPVASSRIPQSSRTALSQRVNNQKPAPPSKLPTRGRPKAAVPSTSQSAPRRHAPARAVSPDPLLIASTSRRPPAIAEPPAPPPPQPTREPVRATGGATPTLHRPDDTFVFVRHDEDDTMIGRISLPSDMAALSSSEVDDDDDVPTPRPRPKGRAVTGLGRLLTPQASSQDVGGGDADVTNASKISSLAAPSTRRTSMLSRPRPPTPESQEVSSQARAPGSPPRPAVPSDTIEEYDTPLREPPEPTRQMQARLSATPKASTKRKSMPSAPDTERPKSARKRLASPTPELSENTAAKTPAATTRNRPQARESAKKRASTPKTQTPNRKRRSSTAERRKTMSGATPRIAPAEVLASRGIRVGIAREALKATPGDDPLLLMGASRERRLLRLSQTPGRSPQKAAPPRVAMTEPRLTTNTFGFPARNPPKLSLLGVTEEESGEGGGGEASDDDGEGAGNDTFVDVRSRRELPTRPPTALGEARPSELSRPTTPAETASTRLASAVARSRSASRSKSPPVSQATSPNPSSLLQGLQRFIDNEPAEDIEDAAEALEPTYVSPVASPRGLPHPEDDAEDIHEVAYHDDDFGMADGYRSPSYSPGPPDPPSPGMSPPMSFDAPTPNVANTLDFDSPSLQRILRGSGSEASETFSPSGASPLLPRRFSRFAPLSSDPPQPPNFTARASRPADIIEDEADHSDSFDADHDTIIAHQSADLSARDPSPPPDDDEEERDGDREEPPTPQAALEERVEAMEEVVEEDEHEEEEAHDNLPIARSPSPGYSPALEPESDLEGNTVIITDETGEEDNSGEIELTVTEVDTAVVSQPVVEAARHTPPPAAAAEQTLAVPQAANSTRARTEPPVPSSPFVSRTGFRFFSPAASGVDLATAPRLSSTPVVNRLSPARESAARRLSPLSSAPALVPPSPAVSVARSVSPAPPTGVSAVSVPSVYEDLDEELGATPLESSREPSRRPSAEALETVADNAAASEDEDARLAVIADTSVEQPSIEVDTTAGTVAAEDASLDVDATADTIAIDDNGVSGQADEDDEDAQDEDTEEDSTNSPRWSISTHRSSIADVVNAALAAGMVLEDQSASPSSDTPAPDPPSTPSRPQNEETAATSTPGIASEATVDYSRALPSASQEPQPVEGDPETAPDPELPLRVRRRMDAGSTPVRPRVSGASQPSVSRRASEVPRVEEPPRSPSPAPQAEPQSTPLRLRSPSPTTVQRDVTPPPSARPTTHLSPPSPAVRTRGASQRPAPSTPATMPATAPRSVPASTGRLRLEAVEIVVSRRSLGFPDGTEGRSPSATAHEPSSPRYFMRRSTGAPGATSQLAPDEGSASTPRSTRDDSTSPQSRTQLLSSPVSLRSGMRPSASPTASLSDGRIDTTPLPAPARSPFRAHDASLISPRSPRLGLSPAKAAPEQATSLSPAPSVQVPTSKSLSAVPSSSGPTAARSVASASPEPNSSNDDAGLTTSLSSSIETSSPPTEVADPSPERPVSPVRHTSLRFGATPRITVPEVDKPGYAPSSPISPTILSPALASRLSSELTFNFGAVTIGSPSRVLRLGSLATSRASTTEDQQRATGEAPAAASERASPSLETPFEEEDTVDAPFEEGDTLDVPFEEGDTVEAPFEEGDTLDAPFEEGDTLDAPFEKGDTLDAPFEEGDTDEAREDDSSTESLRHEAVLDENTAAPLQEPGSVATTEVFGGNSLDEASIDERRDADIQPALDDQAAPPVSPTQEPSAAVLSASRQSSLAPSDPPAQPTPIQSPVAVTSQRTPARSSRPSTPSPALATRTPITSAIPAARTLSFSSASRTPLASAPPRPPLVDYDSDDADDDIGANDTIEGVAGAWDVTAADVRFDEDAAHAIRFEEAEINDSRLDWDITAIAPALGAAASWASPRAASPSSPSLPAFTSPSASRSPLTLSAALAPVAPPSPARAAPPSPAQSSRAPSISVTPSSPARDIHKPSLLAVQSPARATREQSRLASHSPARAPVQRTAASPSIHPSIPSSDYGTSEDPEEEAQRTLRHDAPPPPSDGFLPASSPWKASFVQRDESVEADGEDSAITTALVNGHRAEADISVEFQGYGQRNGHYDEEQRNYKDHPDGDDDEDDHLDNADGDDELGDGPSDESGGLSEDGAEEEEELSVEAPPADDGRILLALVPRGIVKIEPDEERYEEPHNEELQDEEHHSEELYDEDPHNEGEHDEAPQDEELHNEEPLHEPVTQAPTQQHPALEFPARVGIPSPFVLAEARSRRSAQAASQHNQHLGPAPASEPSNRVAGPSNAVPPTQGPPAQEETVDKTGPSARRPVTQQKAATSMPPPPPPVTTSWQTSRPRIPSALAQEISNSSPASTAKPSPARSLHDELETAAAENESVFESEDGSESSSEPFNSVVEIVSTDPFAAARAAAILKVNYEYVEHGILPDGTPRPVTRPFLRTASEIAEDVANRSFPDGTVDLQSIVHDAELDLSYRADWSRSPSHFSSRAPDSPLPIPGGWGNRSSTKRKREDGHEGTARKKRTHDALLFTKADWGRLDKVYRSERRKWIRERDSGALHEWDESRVVEAFIEKQELDETDLVARWRRDLLADYVAALGRRLTGKDKAAEKQPEANATRDEPNTTQVEPVPPSTIKRVIDWVWGVGTGRKRGSGGVVKRVQTPYVGGAADHASPSDDPYQHDDSHARINYSRSRRSVSVQLPDGAGGLQLRTLDESFDIGDVTMAQTPSRPVARPLRPLDVAPRAPPIEEEESESADEAEEAEESVRGDSDSALEEEEEEEEPPKRPRRAYGQPASREYRYGAGDADNSRRLFAPVYPSLPDRSAALTSVVSGTPRPLVKVRSGPAEAIPFALGGPSSSRSALPGGSMPHVKNIVRGFEASRQLDLSYESRRREKEKAAVGGMRRVSSRVESLNESFAQSSSGGSSFEHDYE